MILVKVQRTRRQRVRGGVRAGRVNQGPQQEFGKLLQLHSLCCNNNNNGLTRSHNRDCNWGFGEDLLYLIRAGVFPRLFSGGASVFISRSTLNRLIHRSATKNSAFHLLPINSSGRGEA
jgi:hypothetical protein